MTEQPTVFEIPLDFFPVTLREKNLPATYLQRMVNCPAGWRSPLEPLAQQNWPLSLAWVSSPGSGCRSGTVDGSCS